VGDSRTTRFICTNCGWHDFGRYCSHCRSPLQPNLDQLPGLFKRSLVSTGYEQIVKNSIGTSTSKSAQGTSPQSLLPGVLVDRLFTSLEGFALTDVELLALDRSNMHQLEVLIVMNVDRVTYAAILDCVTSLVSTVNDSELDLRKIYKLKNVSLIFYFFFANGINRAFVDEARSRFPRRITFQFNVNVSFFGVSATAKDFYPRSLLLVDPEKRQLLRSLFAQYHLEDSLREEQRTTSFWETFVHFGLERPTEEIRKFLWIFFNILSKPMYYAAEIDRGRLSLKTALSYLLLLVIIDVAFDKAVGLNETSAVVDLVPFGGEILVFLLFVVLCVVAAGLIHVPLKLLGGKGRFEQTFITQIILTVIFLPIATAIDAGVLLCDPDAYRSMTNTPGSQAQYGLSSMYMFPMLSVVHRVTKAKVGGAFVIALFLTVMLVVGSLLAFT
jgi:hypothetical protein